jgi:AcrR family transcriptional regulator
MRPEGTWVRSGADTNKIARAVGYAQQNFYRHFRDKVGIFVAVDEQWQADERAVMAEASNVTSTEDAIVKAVLSHHARSPFSYRRIGNQPRWLSPVGERDRRASRDAARSRLASLLWWRLRRFLIEPSSSSSMSSHSRGL